jgi:small membrane protein
MTPIQPILIALLLVAAAFHFKGVASRLLSRILIVTFVLLGAIFVVNPEWTNRIARLVGVGRGADLVLYLLFPTTITMFLYLYRKNRETQEKLTGLVRHIALQQAVHPGGASDAGSGVPKC